MERRRVGNLKPGNLVWDGESTFGVVIKVGCRGEDWDMGFDEETQDLFVWAFWEGTEEEAIKSYLRCHDRKIGDNCPCSEKPCRGLTAQRCHGEISYLYGETFYLIESQKEKETKPTPKKPRIALALEEIQ